MKNTLILLIHFEGEIELQDQNYLNSRYSTLLNILNDKEIDKEKCIIVFDTYNLISNPQNEKDEYRKIENPTTYGKHNAFHIFPDFSINVKRTFSRHGVGRRPQPLGAVRRSPSGPLHARTHSLPPLSPLAHSLTQ